MPLPPVNKKGEQEQEQGGQEGEGDRRGALLALFAGLAEPARRRFFIDLFSQCSTSTLGFVSDTIGNACPFCFGKDPGGRRLIPCL